MRLTKDKTVRCKRRKEKLLHFCLRPVINNRDLSRIEDILAPNIPYRKGNKTVQFATYNRFITSHKLLQYIGSFHKSCCFRPTILIRLIIENHTRWSQKWNTPPSNSGLGLVIYYCSINKIYVTVLALIPHPIAWFSRSLDGTELFFKFLDIILTIQVSTHLDL